MKNLCLLFILLASFFSSYAQNTTPNSNIVKRYYYEDSIVSIEKWYGDDKKIDSFKTYHRTGKIDEKFYYLNGRYQGFSYKYNRAGDKITTWEFNKGRLINRVDHIIGFNKKNEEKVKKLHINLKKVNANLKADPTDIKSRLQRAYIRNMLGNRVLSLRDLNWQQYRITKIAKHNNKKPSSKALARIYDRKAWIYSHFKMKNYATHYMHKAVKSDPKNNRLVFNLGAYLYKIKSYDLSKHYLNKSLKSSPKHAFTHRVLASLYSDFEDYEKAKYHIDIAFPNEKNLIKYGHGNLENDIRTLRGYISHNLGNSENGINDLKEAIALNKNNSYAHRNLGVVYYDLGEYKLACEHLQKAKNLDYEKIHDKDNLETYLEFSCKNVDALNQEVNAKIAHEKSAKLSEKPFISPNPTKGNLHISNIDVSNFNYLIFDYTGKLVTQGISNDKSINIYDLSAGIYIVKMTSKNTTETFRVVKE